MKALNVALLITFFTLLAFVTVVVLCNIRNIQIQDSLINMFLGIIGTEIATCGGITIFKNRRKAKKKGAKDE